MIITKIVNEIEEALKQELVDNKPLHKKLVEKLNRSQFVWKQDYTIAVAKDNSKTKVANLMVCNDINEEPQTFRVKREGDFWKKLDARDDYLAVIECATFTNSLTLCDIEQEARDILRSRKEVHSVAGLGFVWVVSVDIGTNIDSIFKLYFKENVFTLEKENVKYYIGWTPKLKEVDMRNFVCPPVQKKVKLERR